MFRIDADAAGIDAFLEGDSFTSAFNALFIIVPVLIVGTIVLMIVLAVVNARRLRSKGINPLATEAEIVADAVRSSAAQRSGAQPARATGRTQSLEARLAEIEQLHAAGKITGAERDAARASVLGTL
jgi:hypothetical protein